MSYGSLMEQIIKDCHAKGLSTKTFSEFSSQTAKSQKQKARTSELMSLENSRESVEETARFLDGEFNPMGSIKARDPMFAKTWENLPKDISQEQLAETFEINIDNPELLRLMKEDLRTGAITSVVPWPNEMGDLEKFYSLWRQPFHLKQLHEVMVKDVRSGLELGVPDVIIMVAGTPHIKGLDLQLTELRDAKKVVVGNVPQCSTILENVMYNGNPRLVDGVAERVEFDVDLVAKKAIVPALITEAINEKSRSKLDALDLAAPHKQPSSSPERTYLEKMSQVKGDNFKEI